MHRLPIVGFAVALAALASTSSALAGPDWDEVGDAGSLISTAQTPTGLPPLSPLNSIHGNLSVGLLGGDFQDVYEIFICDPTAIAFSAGTDPSFGGFATFDTQLWLFDSAGFGLLGNNDVTFGGGSGFLDMSTDGSGITITTPGTYYIAVSGLGSSPFSSGPADAIFSFGGSPFEVSGPDGPGGASILGGWTSPGAVGEYKISFTGACFPVPAPGVATIIAIAACAASSRRRRA